MCSREKAVEHEMELKSKKGKKWQAKEMKWKRKNVLGFDEIS